MKIFWLSLLLCAPACAIPVSVTVVDGDQQPLEGANVQILSFGDEKPLPLQFTDAAGQLRLEAKPHALWPQFLGRAAIWKEGFAVGGGDLKLASKTQDSLAVRYVLETPKIVRGRVLDSAGQPLANAKVAARIVGLKNPQKGESGPTLFEGPLLEKISAQTNANGEFEIKSLSPRALVYLYATARGFALEQLSNQKTDFFGAPLQIKLHPGVVVAGRVLGIDGAPLGGIEVMAQGTDRGGADSWAQAQTDAAGRFELWGLEKNSEVNLAFTAPRGANYVIGARGNLRLGQGETLDIGEVRAQSGFLIGGVVRDPQGAGVPGIQVGIYGTLNPASGAAVGTATTDKDGRWQFRTLPGAHKIYLMGVPGEWKNEQQEKNLTLESAKNDLDFALSPAIRVRGTVVDEAGKPVPARLYASSRKDDGGFYILADEDGTFTASAPQNGSFNVLAQPPYSPPGEWEIVSPRQISAPSQTPIQIVVKKRVVETWTLKTQDSDGNPLGGVSANFYYQTRDNTIPRDFESDAKGEITLPKPLTGEKISFQSASKDGFDFVSGGNLENGAPAPLVFAPRDGILRGKILDSNGAPVADATVWSWNSQTQSAPDGSFELRNLSRGAGEVLALGAAGFGRGNGEVRLQKQKLQAQNLELARQIESETRAKFPTEYDEAYGAFLPGQSAQEWENWVAERDEKRSRRNLEAQIEAGVEIPAISTQRFLEIAEKFPVDQVYLGFVAQIWSARNAQKTFDFAPFAAHLDEWKVRSQKIKTQNEMTWEGTRIFLALAGMEARRASLENRAPDFAFFDEAVKWLWKQGDQPGDGRNVTPASILAQNSDALGQAPQTWDRLFNLVQNEGEGAAYALQNRAKIVAQSDGLAAATPFLEKLQTLGAQPNDEGENDGPRVSIPWLYANTTSQLIRDFGVQNGELALQLAQKIPDDNHVGFERAQALGEAAFWLPIERARGIWRENVPRLRQAGDQMRLISRIQKVYVSLARELYEEAREAFDSPKARRPWETQGEGGNSLQSAIFAFYEADFDANRARFRLEKTWASPGGKTSQLVRAMAKLDAGRALEWADALKAQEDERNPNFYARRAVARFLAANEKAREGWRVDAWEY